MLNLHSCLLMLCTYESIYIFFTIYVSLLFFLQDFGLNVTTFLAPYECFSARSKSSNHGHINTLIANLHHSLRYFSYIHNVFSMSHILLKASISAVHIVSGAMSEIIISYLKACDWIILSTSSCSLMSCSYAVVKGNCSVTFLRSNQTTLPCILFSVIYVEQYCNQLHGAHHISMIFFGL